MKDHITLKNKAKETKTEIYFGFDLLSDQRFLETCQKLGKRFVIVTDKKVGSLYGKSLQSLLKENDLDCLLITFPDGEASKSRKTKEKVEDEMFEAKLGRDTCLIALGGGVVTDLAGFVAATYCRGIPYLLVPTSLLGMVDASIGSKTGLNVKQGKNLLGSIYSPAAIFMDLSSLSTLSDREMRNGTAEIIKHGLIAEAALYSSIVEHFEKWQQRDLALLKNLIYESSLVKKKVVEADLKESGMRRMLNFGHTIGHAIEAIEGYGATHGEAIAIGMIVESFISFKLGHINETDFDDIYRLFKLMDFPLQLSSKVTIDAMIHVMGSDKKAAETIPRFVVLNGIGKVLSFKGEYCTTIDDAMLHEVLGWMVAEFFKG